MGCETPARARMIRRVQMKLTWRIREKLGSEYKRVPNRRYSLSVTLRQSPHPNCALRSRPLVVYFSKDHCEYGLFEEVARCHEDLLVCGIKTAWGLLPFRHGLLASIFFRDGGKHCQRGIALRVSWCVRTKFRRPFWPAALPNLRPFLASITSERVANTSCKGCPVNNVRTQRDFTNWNRSLMPVDQGFRSLESPES